MEISVKKADVIWSYLGTFISLSSNIVTIPLLVYYLEPDALGLWYVFVSIGSIANLFDFGFSLTFARNITYCWSGARTILKEDVAFTENTEPDFRLMKNILSTCKGIYLILSVSVLVLLFSLGTIYIMYVSKEMIGWQHIVAWFIYAIATFLNLYYNYYDSFLRGVGAVAIANKNRIIARSVHLILMVVLLIAGTGLIGAAVAYLSYGTIFRILGKYKFYRYKGIGDKIRKVKEESSKIDKTNVFKAVWYNAWRDGVIQISSYCCDSLSVLICSLYLSLSETGVYSIAMQLAIAVSTLSSVLYATYQPSIQTAYANRDKKKLCESMSVLLTVFIISFVVGSICAVFVGIPILKLIKPASVVSIPVLVGVLLNQFILKYRNCYTSYFSSTNRIIYMNAFIISAVLCVGLSFLFIGYLHWGVWGLISAQIISQCIYNIWYWPVKANKELGVGILDKIHLAFIFLKNKLFKIN